MKNLRSYTIFEILWFGVPVAIWFSYQPLFRLGENETMYFELSIAVVYTLIMALSGTALIWRMRKSLILNRAVWLVSGFVAWAALTLLWTDNLLRGLLTIGLLGTIYMIFLASLSISSRLIKLLPGIAKIYIITSVIMSIIAFIQFFMGVWFDSNITLLCAGCEAIQFGFARPNVFTIEPQFFGNMLLAPSLVLMWLLINGNKNKLAHLSFIIILCALFLTLSRGAIYAFAIGVIAILIISRVSMDQIIRVLALITVAILSSLLLQGLGGQLNPRLDVTFADSIDGSVNHLTLGVVDFIDDTNQNKTNAKPNFDGYVEESSTIRTRLTVSALETWSQSLGRAIFGVGLGGSGVALSEQFPERYIPREIVQNEYAKILLEMGIVGLILFVSLIVGLFYKLRNHKWTWSIIVALSVQWLFFSGYPNALHIFYIFIALYIYGMSNKSSKPYI